MNEAHELMGLIDQHQVNAGVAVRMSNASNGFLRGSFSGIHLAQALREIGGTFEGQLLRRAGSHPYEPSVVTENAV